MKLKVKDGIVVGGVKSRNWQEEKHPEWETQ